MLNSIFGRRKTFEVSSPEITYKVHYLGNVMTCLLKGSFMSSTAALNLDSSLNEEINSNQLFSIDKPVKILWDNHVKHGGQAGIKMSLTLTQGGLRVDTRDHGVTEYYGHRIYLCKAHSINPKLLIWVYQHVGKNLKTEIRCHAALCQSSKHASAIDSLLNDKLKQTFSDYKREKKRLQNSRLCNTKNGGLLQNQLSNKKKTFRKATQNYKPPVQHGMCSAPRLDDVIEEDEDEFDEENEKMVLIEEENEDMIEQEEEDEEINLEKKEAFLHKYDNKVSPELILSSSSSSSVSSSYPSPNIQERPEYESVILPQNTQKAYLEVSYEFLSDLSQPQEPKKSEIKHSKSFMNKNDKNMAKNPFRRTNFSRSFTEFTAKFKHNRPVENLNHLRNINELKELNLNENLNQSQASTSSLSSPTLSTSSKSSNRSSDVNEANLNSDSSN